MSGILGIFHTDGAPADSQQLAAMTNFLRFRGPDAQRVWTSGPVGFGHAALHTTAEAPHWPQPLALDNELFITGDVRLDDRVELKTKLLGKGHEVPDGADDALLVLQAYRAWGRDCLEHLAGDFCFALWDARARSLFCARDQMGVKPFFYALKRDTVIFSNTLNCIRLWPEISDELNDSAVADYLMSGCWLQNAEDTFFADIKRLPSAHWLEVSSHGVRTHKYWAAPLGPIRRGGRARDYAEEFKHLLSQSISERLRSGKAAIQLSGGVDSSTVATMACTLLGANAGSALHAYTVGYDRLLDDVEPCCARRVAECLCIPWHYLSLDDCQHFPDGDGTAIAAPEPYHPLTVGGWELLRAIAGHSRVALTGQGGDVVVGAVSLGHGFCWRHIPGAIRYTIARRRFAPIGVRSAIRRWRSKPAPYPAWMNPDLEHRLDLPARWTHYQQEPPPLHPTRPLKYNSVASHSWQQVFQVCDPGFSGYPVQVRHPLFSLKIISHVFTIPAHMENFCDKGMLRALTRGLLPEDIRLRPKTPASTDVVTLSIRSGRWDPTAEIPVSPLLWRYLKPGTPTCFRRQQETIPSGWDLVPIVSLNWWLSFAFHKVKRLGRDVVPTTCI